MTTAANRRRLAIARIPLVGLARSRDPDAAPVMHIDLDPSVLGVAHAGREVMPDGPVADHHVERDGHLREGVREGNAVAISRRKGERNALLVQPFGDREALLLPDIDVEECELGELGRNLLKRLTQAVSRADRRDAEFQQHVRAVAGWPLGDGARHSDAVMTNLIGDEAAGWLRLAGEGGGLHLYGKAEIRAGRKMGHVTRLAPRSA